MGFRAQISAGGSAESLAHLRYLFHDDDVVRKEEYNQEAWGGQKEEGEGIRSLTEVEDRTGHIGR